MPVDAYYRGFVDPAPRRLLLESMLHRPAPPRDAPGSAFGAYDQYADEVSDATAALFPLDPARALGFINQYSGSSRLRGSRAAWLLCLMSIDPSKWPMVPPEN